jgi:ATP-binding cassette subfamily B protein
MATYLLPTWQTALLTVLCVTGSAVLGALPPLIIKMVIDTALRGHDRVLLAVLVAVLVGIGLVVGLLGVWQNYLVSVVAQNVMFDLRLALFEKVLRQPLNFLKKTPAGAIMARLQIDVGTVQGVITNTVVALLTNALIVMTSVVALVRMDPVLASIALILLPVFILPTRRVGRAGYASTVINQAAVGDLGAFMHEMLSVHGSLTIRILGARQAIVDGFRARAATLRHQQLQLSRIGRWYTLLLALFGTIGPAVVLAIGGLRVIEGTASVGTVVAVVFYLGRLYAPMSALFSVHVELMNAGAVFARIFEYLDLPEDHDAGIPALAPLTRPPGVVHVENVGLKYDDTWALQGLSFDVAPDECVAVVGPSGSGKSTLGLLLARMYDPTVGHIRINGVPLRELSPEDAAAAVGLVTQDPVLFNMSIAANLRLGRADASQEQLEAACRLAQIHDVIDALPGGYEAVVGEQGTKLSGGERQRISIARILLRDPAVVILDEATSALDTLSEARVHAAVRELLRTRASIIIAHRIATVTDASRIIVLDKGRMIAMGQHVDLLRSCSLYSRLVEGGRDPSAPQPYAVGIV